MGKYKSPRFDEAVLIDDGRPPVMSGSTGHVNRDWNKKPFGSLDFAKPFGRQKLDRKALIERIKEKDEANSWMTDIIRHYKRPILNQGKTNYCHVNAPTGCVMTKQCLMGGGWHSLSPASVGGPVTGYKNIGGWGGPALKRIKDFGIYYVEDWPANAIERKYMTTEGSRRALENQITDWEETEEGDFLALATLVCDDIPCFIGIPNWGHEVEVTQILYDESKDIFSPYGPNSWGQYNNDGGFYQVTEKYIRGFDCYGAVSVDP